MSCLSTGKLVNVGGLSCTDHLYTSGHVSAVQPSYPSKIAQARDANTSKEGLRQRTDPGEAKSTRGGRARGRGGRTKRGRAPLSNVVNGPERVNGSMTVHS